jgi:hypothetical protein
MNSYEEELQKRLERGERPGDKGLDTRAYREVFRALEKDPGYQLSDDFPQRVISAVRRRQQGRDTRDYLWFGMGILLLAVASIATILFTGFRFDFGFLNTMADYKGLAVFGIMFVILLNWLDKRLVRRSRVTVL